MITKRLIFLLFILGVVYLCLKETRECFITKMPAKKYNSDMKIYIKNIADNLESNMVKSSEKLSDINSKMDELKNIRNDIERLDTDVERSNKKIDTIDKKMDTMNNKIDKMKYVTQDTNKIVKEDPTENTIEEDESDYL